jgi:hypothetical protein
MMVTSHQHHGRTIAIVKCSTPTMDPSSSRAKNLKKKRVTETLGVVHAWVGQKLLNCFIFKCFTRKTLKKNSIGHR